MEVIRTQTQSSKISFNNQTNGYDIAQVDAYIKSISEAYQSAYEQYYIICKRYNQLLENFKKLQTREQSRPSAEVISNTLLDAEVLSKKIIADAKAEAEKIRKAAYIDKAAAEKQAQKFLDDATDTAVQVKDKARKILDCANSEAAKLNANAQAIIENAHSEATKIKIRAVQDALQAREKIARTASQMQHLLLPRVMDVQPGRGASDAAHIK